MKKLTPQTTTTFLLPPSALASSALVNMKAWMQYKHYDMQAILDHCNAATYFMYAMRINSPKQIDEYLLMMFETNEMLESGPRPRYKRIVFDALKVMLTANHCSTEILDAFFRNRRKKGSAMAA